MSIKSNPTPLGLANPPTAGFMSRRSSPAGSPRLDPAAPQLTLMQTRIQAVSSMGPGDSLAIIQFLLILAGVLRCWFGAWPQGLGMVVLMLLSVAAVQCEKRRFTRFGIARILRGLFFYSVEDQTGSRPPMRFCRVSAFLIVFVVAVVLLCVG